MIFLSHTHIFAGLNIVVSKKPKSAPALVPLGNCRTRKAQVEDQLPVVLVILTGEASVVVLREVVVAGARDELVVME
jgi:hypothetical protein